MTKGVTDLLLNLKSNFLHTSLLPCHPNHMLIWVCACLYKCASCVRVHARVHARVCQHTDEGCPQSIQPRNRKLSGWILPDSPPMS